MITLGILFTLIFIYTTIKIKRNTPKNEEFDPFGHSITIVFTWLISGMITFLFVSQLCLTYLP